MQRGRAIVLVAVLAFSFVSIPGDPAQAQRPGAQASKSKSERDRASVWMREKLAASQKILEGLTKGDFALIEKQAVGMQNVSYMEGWFRAEVPGYKAQLHAFDYANDGIIQSARYKNLDGVTLAYTQLTISCVQCHKIVRDKASG
jgi:hypothetical protein